MQSKRGKYRFGLLEIGETAWSTPEMRKGSARSIINSLKLTTTKRFRLLSDKQGFVVLRIA